MVGAVVGALVGNRGELLGQLHGASVARAGDTIFVLRDAGVARIRAVPYKRESSSFPPVAAGVGDGVGKGRRTERGQVQIPDPVELNAAVPDI